MKNTANASVKSNFFILNSPFFYDFLYRTVFLNPQ
nr:MAG TPA: hypothetical protein [Caudoviricetes sp.]